MLDWLGLEDNREEPVDLGVNVKEIEGNETEDNAENNIDIKTEIKDGIVTTETVTREEQIIFSKQNAKTAPISVRLDESGKEIIEFKNENAIVEEETCLLENNLEIIKGEEEVVNRVIESEKTDDEEKRENGELYENGTGEERMKSDDEENKDESENDEENKDESENDEGNKDKSENDGGNKDESENDESLMDEE